jgi:hypothetical protein
LVVKEKNPELLPGVLWSLAGVTLLYPENPEVGMRSLPSVPTKTQCSVACGFVAACQNMALVDGMSLMEGTGLLPGGGGIARGYC